MDPLALAAKCSNLLVRALSLHGALLLHHPVTTKSSPAAALGLSLLARH